MKQPSRSRQLDQAGFSAEELRIAAAKSDRSGAARLRALADKLDGDHTKIICERYGVSETTLFNWIRRLVDFGIVNLSVGGVQGRRSQLKHCNKVTLEDLASARKGAGPAEARRLLAISRLLQQVPYKEVAREAQVARSTLSSWVTKFNVDGISGLLAKDRSQRRKSMRSDISAIDVREAAKGAPIRRALRLRAIADVLDGMKLGDVARSLDVSPAMVGKWCNTFNRDGLEGLIDKWEIRANKKLASSFGR